MVPHMCPSVRCVVDEQDVLSDVAASAKAGLQMLVSALSEMCRRWIFIFTLFFLSPGLKSQIQSQISCAT